MAYERNDSYEGHEEGEYHFSDDEANYEDETGHETHAAATSAVPTSTKNALMDGSNPYRRMLIAIPVFFIIVFIVYKMLLPASTPSDVDLSQNAANTPAVSASPKPAKQQIAKAAPPQNAPSTDAIPSKPEAETQPQPVAAPVVTPQPNLAPTSTDTSTPTVAPIPVPVEPMNPPAVQTVTPVSTPMISASTGTEAAMSSPETKNLTDRLAVLEEQNAKLTNIMQTQVAQKLADYDAQTNAAQERIHALNKRLANIEASITKLAELMQEQGMGKVSAINPPGGLPAAKPVEPKVAYTVQAIIPGRAWLKSDSGDTVTVAEGDMLKEYGRITKIDPYDGVVDIDTGSKIITLSYGAGGD